MSDHEHDEDLVPDATERLEEEPLRRVEPVVVPRWIQLVALPLALLALYAMAKAAGVVLLLFVIAAVIALILTPLVTLLQRGRLPRALAIVCVYVGFLGVLVLAGILVANPISAQVTSLRDA